MEHPTNSAAVTDEALVDWLVGPQALGGRKSFARRHVIVAAAHRMPVRASDAATAAARLYQLVDLVLADPRVVPVVGPRRWQEPPQQPDHTLANEIGGIAL